MLCPNCGTDVGDELRLCPNCRFEPTAAASQRNAASSARNIIADDVEEFDTSPPSVAEALRSGKGPLNILIRYVLPAIAGLLASVAFMTIYAPKAIRPLTNGNTPNTNLQLTPSRALLGMEALRFDSVLLYNDATSVLHVGFYRGLPASFNRELLSSVPSLADVRGERPDLLLSIRFAGERGCETGEIESATLTFNAAPKGFTLAQPQVSLVAVGPGAAEAGANALKPGLSGLQCNTGSGGRAQGTFAASPRLTFKDEAQIVTLDLTFNGPLIHTAVADEVFYRSASAQDTVALLNGKKNQVAVGYFSKPLPVSASEKMRTSHSLLAVPELQPEAVITFAYEPGTTKLALDKLKSYSVTLYRSDRINKALPGSESSATAAFIGVPTEQLATSRLQGALGEGLVISGAFIGSTTKQIDGRSFKLAWNLEIMAPLLDVAEASLGGEIVPLAAATASPTESQPTASPTASPIPTPAASETPTVAPQPSATTAPSEFFGDMPAAADTASLTFDGTKLAFRSIVPIFYEDTGDLALGFFVDELTPAEVQEIQRRRLLQGGVKNRRPEMVIIFDFRAGTVKLDDKALVGYTIYFYRDASGQLGFPGVHESISFKRSVEKFTATDRFGANGSLTRSAEVQLQLEGTSQSEKSPAAFSWAINTTITVP